eukprot:TRINITY_DN2993_c0_g1_i1.p1 TRINITY_DN2993_c0_g1~~TRINITY_DN2993_c0_g1_i1.p1  ORF type:complete len:69 (-),score=5.40 TRINITY_DN2993_c0_g1_i1:13-219(-)
MTVLITSATGFFAKIREGKKKRSKHGQQTKNSLNCYVSRKDEINRKLSEECSLQRHRPTQYSTDDNAH